MKGKQVEKAILQAMSSQHLWVVDPASDEDDKHHKVDAYIFDRPEDGWVPVQVKYRERGNDVGVEVFREWYDWDDPRNEIGRDMRGRAKYYLILMADRQTVLYIPIYVLKTIIESLMIRGKVRGLKDAVIPVSRKGEYLGMAVLRVFPDPRTLVQKMVAYIPPAMLQEKPGVKTYTIDLEEFSE